MNNEINTANLRKIQQRLDAMQTKIDELNKEVDLGHDYIFSLNALVNELMRGVPLGLAGVVAGNLDRGLQQLSQEQRLSPGSQHLDFWCDELFRLHQQQSPEQSAFHFDEQTDQS